jgi:hypothetical protein
LRTQGYEIETAVCCCFVLDVAGQIVNQKELKARGIDGSIDGEGKRRYIPSHQGYEGTRQTDTFPHPFETTILSMVVAGQRSRSMAFFVLLPWSRKDHWTREDLWKEPSIRPSWLVEGGRSWVGVAGKGRLLKN